MGSYAAAVTKRGNRSVSRRQRRSGPLLVAVFALLLVCALAIPRSPHAAGPLEINSDRLEMDEKKQVAIFSGRVRAKDGGMRLAADRMTVYYYRKGKGRGIKANSSGVREVRAEGRVKLEEGKNRGSAERMVYRIGKQTLELLGREKNAIIQYGDDRLEGKQIVLTIGADRHIQKVSVRGGDRKRVSARITPSGEVLNGSRDSRSDTPAAKSGAETVEIGSEVRKVRKKSRGERPPPNALPTDVETVSEP